MPAVLESVGATPASDFDSQGFAPTVPLHGRKGVIRAFCTVDWADYEWACRYRWFLHTNGYAYRCVTRSDRSPSGKFKSDKIKMHRDLFGLPKGREHGEVDHINHDKLDNRRSNLRVVTRSQNAQNGSAHKDSKYSKHRGVTYCVRNRVWIASAMCEGKRYSGRFKTEREAADAAARYREQHMPYSEEAMA